jgi:uncharacterized protein (DUF433 family)
MSALQSSASVQRSFRLSSRTSELLDEMAESTNESRNALADRLLGESLRTERHPLIRYRTGVAGRREPFVVGTRLLVRQLIAQLRASDGDVEAVATYLEIPVRLVRAAVSFYAELAAEVDADAARAARVESEEHVRWQREQAAHA